MFFLVFFIRNYTKNRTEHKRIGLVTQYSLNRDDLRHSFTTRLLHSLIPATWYASKDASVFDLCQALANDLTALLHTGVSVDVTYQTYVEKIYFFWRCFVHGIVLYYIYISTSYILRSYICMPSEVGQGQMETFYISVVAIKGDWPWLRKCMALYTGFTSRRICHLCEGVEASTNDRINFLQCPLFSIYLWISGMI